MNRSAPGLSPEELWDLHGSSLFWLACVSLGDQSAALRAVTLGMVDLYAPPETDRHVALDGSLQTAARCVYQRCQVMLAERSIQRTMILPRPMVCLGELAHSQRDALALCVFGGHDYRQAARLLHLAPEVTARLLTSGLLELGWLATAGDSNL